MGKMVMAMERPGKRRSGRPTRRYLERLVGERELSGEDRVKWRRLIRNIDPT